MPKWLSVNNVLKVVTAVVGVAGVIVTAPAAAFPVAVVGVAMKVLTYGGVLVGIGAAKYLPGHGANAPAETPKAP